MMKLMMTLTAAAALVLAAGAKAGNTQDVLDNNGNVIGHIYDNRPGYGELPELPELPSIGDPVSGQFDGHHLINH
jgi:hypothetical protein